MKRLIVVLLILSVLALPSFATPVTVTNSKLQSKYGTLTNVYFETASGPGSSTPSANTAQTPSGSSSSYSIPQGTSGHLWSPQFASSATISAGNWVFDFWASTISYAAITLTNSQSAATPNPLQEKITWNPSTYASYEASNLGNIRFCLDTACATQLNAWLESCTPSCSNSATSASAWVKLTSSIAASGGTLKIYMAFLATSYNFDGNYWGEAPQISSTYGQYDNGANVFAFYDGFAGTSLSSKWTVFDSSAGTISVNNGLTVTSSSTSVAVGIFASYAASTTGMVTETYFDAVNPLAGYRVFDGSGIASSSTTESNGYVGILGATGDTLVVLGKMASGTQTNLNTYAESLTAGTYYENSLTWQGNSLTISDLTSGHSATATDSTYSLSSSTQVSLALGAATGNKYMAYWYRVRLAPPSNVLPSASFGSVSSTANTLSVSIFVTGSTGTVQATVASAVVSPSLGAAETQLSMTFAGSQVTVPSSGYIEVSFAAGSATDSMYWGSGQQTNFQVPFRVLT